MTGKASDALRNSALVQHGIPPRPDIVRRRRSPFAGQSPIDRPTRWDPSAVASNERRLRALNADYEAGRRDDRQREFVDDGRALDQPDLGQAMPAVFRVKAGGGS